jgi:hypothetical protein
MEDFSELMPKMARDQQSGDLGLLRGIAYDWSIWDAYVRSIVKGTRESLNLPVDALSVTENIRHLNVVYGHLFPRATPYVPAQPAYVPQLRTLQMRLRDRGGDHEMEESDGEAEEEEEEAEAVPFQIPRKYTF